MSVYKRCIEIQNQAELSANAIVSDAAQPTRLFFDATQLKCPLLFVKTKQYLNKLLPNQCLVVAVNDPIGAKDIAQYLQSHDHRYSVCVENRALEQQPIKQQDVLPMAFHITLKEG